jgi:phage baseplate assembly protein W
MANLSIRAREKVYSDLDFAFRKNPITNDVSLRKDVEAVKQSVLNILLTNRGERVFMSSFGANIRSFLFENIDSVTTALIQEDIIIALANFEPRVRVLTVDVQDKRDMNAINILLEIEILSPVQTTTSVEFIVERLR